MNRIEVPNTRLCVARLAGAWCSKQTLLGFQLAPRNSLSMRYSVQMTISIDCRSDPRAP
ncbi:hypothetical protein D3C71_2103040 [compost metagenome]